MHVSGAFGLTLTVGKDFTNSKGKRSIIFNVFGHFILRPVRHLSFITEYTEVQKYLCSKFTYDSILLCGSNMVMVGSGL